MRLVFLKAIFLIRNLIFVTASTTDALAIEAEPLQTRLLPLGLVSRLWDPSDFNYGVFVVITETRVSDVVVFSTCMNLYVAPASHVRNVLTLSRSRFL